MKADATTVQVFAKMAGTPHPETAHELNHGPHWKKYKEIGKSLFMTRELSYFARVILLDGGKGVPLRWPNIIHESAATQQADPSEVLIIFATIPMLVRVSAPAAEHGVGHQRNHVSPAK